MIPLASSLPVHPGWVQDLQYQLTGFLVVISALGGIALLVWITGRLFAAGGTAKRDAATGPAAESTSEIPGPVLAAISAAVSVALEGRHFVVYSISPAGRGAWSAEGRRAIYRSHQLR